MRKSNAYFDKEGHFYLPMNIKFGGQLKPSLNTREWLLWLFLTAKDNHFAPNNFLKVVGGSLATLYRIKRSLKEKGYL